MSTAYLKASLLVDAFDAGRSEVMPYVLATNDVGLRAFGDVTREDAVEPALLPLLTRLKLPRFSALARVLVGPPPPLLPPPFPFGMTGTGKTGL